MTLLVVFMLPTRLISRRSTSTTDTDPGVTVTNPAAATSTTASTLHDYRYRHVGYLVADL